LAGVFDGGLLASLVARVGHAAGDVAEEVFVAADAGYVELLAAGDLLARGELVDAGDLLSSEQERCQPLADGGEAGRGKGGKGGVVA
jgi:hypothetical protein